MHARKRERERERERRERDAEKTQKSTRNLTASVRLFLGLGFHDVYPMSHDGRELYFLDLAACPQDRDALFKQSQPCSVFVCTRPRPHLSHVHTRAHPRPRTQVETDTGTGTQTGPKPPTFLS